MTSLVNDFIINPVLRQARRFSEASRSTLSGGGGGDDPPVVPVPVLIEEQQHQQTQPHVLTDGDNANNAPASIPSVTCPDSFRRPRLRNHPTQILGVEEAMASPMTPTTEDGTPRDHLGFPLSPKRGKQIPEDDGMKDLRARIQAIHARELPPSEKAKLMHELLLEGYNASRTSVPSHEYTNEPVPPLSQIREIGTPQSTLDSLRFWENQADQAVMTEKFDLSENDLNPTYAPIRRNKSQSGVNTPTTHTDPASLEILSAPLGCQHYERNVKLQCVSCSKWYPCRLCHDAEEDHRLPRFETQHMLCMLCGTPQKASDVCVTCGELSAQYYCNVCKLWENRESKPIYHCYDCGICRRGLGLGKDYFHCKTCCACIPTSIETSHKCIERSTDCNCPICGEYMFTSPKPVVFMACGHSIHKKCYSQHMTVSYKCPICNKSLANMETQFRNLDMAIVSQPMPSEFLDTKAIVLCNDCSGRSTVPYHWLGLKCGICQSYNTVELQILGGVSQEGQATAVERTVESADAPPHSAAELNMAESTREGPTGASGRRRHSSQGVEMQRRASELIVGSYPPLNSRLGHSMAPIDFEAGSEDGFLGFWGAADDDYDDDMSHSGDDSDGSLSDADAREEDDDEDDEEEDNDIMLIGHR